MSSSSRSLLSRAGALLGLAVAATAALSADLPSYRLTYLGPGSPVAISNTGVVAGARTNASSQYEPLVSVNGARWQPLPVLAGAVSVFPTDVNDAGVIVGVSYDAQWNSVAVRWTPGSGGYAVEELPRLAGDPSSYATAINNLGQIVGARRALGYVPAATTGWLYSDSGGVIDLAATYQFWVVPKAINDNGLVIGGVERLNLANGIIDDIGAGPSNYNAVSGVAINNAGQIAGATSLRSTSLNIVSVFRYDEGVGWSYIAGTSRYTVATSINSRGDVGYGELGAGLYLDGLGAYAVNSLLDPTVTAAGWAVTGNGVHVNDQRVLATVGRNSVTGEAGGVLLTPAGVLAPPTAPSNLTATASPATTSKPYDSIELEWTNTSSLTTGYELERSVSGRSDWTRLSLVPPGTATHHTDTLLVPGTPYDYRVRAVGLGGVSAWSNVATATAPASQPTPKLVVSGITLTGKARGGTVNVTGDVLVKDGAGAAVAGANVAVTWTLPGGSTKTASALTGSTGRARFTVSGTRGTYTLTVTGVAKSGYVFDAAGSVLTKSSTR